MKFYMTPGSCSTGIHILLEELEQVFEAYIVSLPAGDHQRPEFVAMNPKSTIPVLVRDDGSVLTEFNAIAWWLGRQFGRGRLMPAELEGEVRALELMDYVVGTLHGQGFARLFVAESFTSDADQFEAVRARGREIVEQGFAILDARLAGREYALGAFSIADAALFYVEFWATRSDIALPAHCAAHYARMLKRPAVRQVLAEEGYRLA